MEEAESIGVARAKRTGRAFAVAGLIVGGLGLFAGGLLASFGTVAALCCVGGVCAAKMAEQLEAHRDRLVETWEPPAAIEPATIASGQEASLELPERNWVASLDLPREPIRSR